MQTPSLENIFKDFYHPNPNINKQAFLDMYNFWPNESFIKLANNLDSQDISIRRKSVKAIASFGIDIVDKIVDLYFTKEDEVYQLSCIKILVLVASNNCLKNFDEKIKLLLKKALRNESAEMILIVISLLKQLGESSIPCLKELCRDSNILRAKASMTALIEFNDSSVNEFLLCIYNDTNLNKLTREFAYDAMTSS